MSLQVAYDYTFLCALEPAARERWASQYAKIVKPGGQLLTVVFPIDGRTGK